MMTFKALFSGYTSFVLFFSMTATSAFVGPTKDAARTFSELHVFKPLTQLTPPAPVDIVKPGEGKEGGSMVKHATGRKKWGVDCESEYWFDSRIHTLGNTGFWGAVHAALAPLSTRIIDDAAYQGVDIRARVAQELATIVKQKEGARILDLCCGVGMSTRALREGFPEAAEVIGVDTSPEMVSMAGFLTSHLSFVKPLLRRILKAFSNAVEAVEDQGRMVRHRAAQAGFCKPAVFVKANAEQTALPDKSFDLVTIMYAFHEAPKDGRDRILREARRLLHPGGTLAVVDIATDYQPSPAMLAGEPYVLEYQQSIQSQMRSFKGFSCDYKILVPGHVGMWVMRRAPSY